MTTLPPAGVAVLAAAAAWPVGPWYAARVADGSDEPWCVVALLTAAAVLVKRGSRQSADVRPPTLLMCLFIMATLFLPPIFRCAAAFLAVGYSLAAWRLGPGMHWGFYGLLVLSTPFTASLDFYCGYPLRTVVSHASSNLLALAGFNVSPEGTLLRWGERLVEVDAPCSGLRMLFAGLYLACTLSALFRFRFLKTAAAVFLGVAATFIANIFRATALFFSESGVVSLPGWTHSVLGLVLFAAMALSLAWSTRRLEEDPA